MIHFTLTGFYAGVPICGANRNDNDTYYHGAYIERLDDMKNDLCPECRKIWEDVENELNEEMS